jgi:hypothetical protein
MFTGPTPTKPRCQMLEFDTCEHCGHDTTKRCENPSIGKFQFWDDHDGKFYEFCQEHFERNEKEDI